MRNTHPNDLKTKLIKDGSNLFVKVVFLAKNCIHEWNCLKDCVFRPCKAQKDTSYKFCAVHFVEKSKNKISENAMVYTSTIGLAGVLFPLNQSQTCNT